jgi:hypothetical protein
MDDLDGWDFGGKWRYAGRGSISIYFPDYDEPRRGTCSFWIDEDRKVLGRVDGFDEDETQSKCDEGTVVHVSLLAT